MIFNFLSAEFIKIFRSKTLRILLIIVPFFAFFFAFFVPYATNQNPKNLLEDWEGDLFVLLLIWQFLSFVLSSLLIIFWQYKEHQADFFNRYRLLPYEFWQILLIRFVGFVLAYVGMLLVAYLLIFLFLPLFFFIFNSKYSFQNLNLLDYTSYFFFSCLTQTLLLLPIFLFLFLFSTKISHLAVNVLVLIGIVLVRSTDLFPSWFFLNVFGKSQGMLRIMFLPTGSDLFKMYELMELYLYSFLWTGLFICILVYFSRFFEPNQN